MSISIKELAQRSDIKFGTSGLRGLVENLTDEVCFAYTKAFLLSQQGTFKKVAIGHDLRPSSPLITQACIAAIESHGLEAIYLGALPTPAVAYYCLNKKIPGVVVTGSHIPFDRNGIKFYRADGEISKADEESIMESFVEIDGHNLKIAITKLNKDAIELYKQRYINFFGSNFLAGKIVAIYQHSSVARDLLDELMKALGAKTILLGLSDDFIPIDTEAVREEDIKQAKAWAHEYDFDMLISTDGDADRPWLADEHGDFIRGDILGIITAQYLEADYVVTPISSNTAIELSDNFTSVSRTKIGSPFVICEMNKLTNSYPRSTIVGYEANGGFLLGTSVTKNGKSLGPLPTRDAILPIISVIGLSQIYQRPISALKNILPTRFTYSERIQNYPEDKSIKLIRNQIAFLNLIQNLFSQNNPVIKIDRTDGLRLTFYSGDIVHIRPSGNAPELRVYSESDSQESAKMLVEKTIYQIRSWEKV